MMPQLVLVAAVLQSLVSMMALSLPMAFVADALLVLPQSPSHHPRHRRRMLSVQYSSSNLPSSSTRIKTNPRKGSSRLFSEEESHLQGIGVGIDLGTTNSAVAMMIPVEGSGGNNRGGKKTEPKIIEVDNKRTIPSVVSFIPPFNIKYNTVSASSSPLSLPPWSDETNDSENDASSWPSLLTKQQKEPYQILVGHSAIATEQHFPRSSYRNVKRIIGTGGTMSQLALGMVPNLYIGSLHTKSSNNDDGSVGGSDVDELTRILLGDNDGGSSSSSSTNSKKKKNNSKGGGKQQRKGKWEKWSEKKKKKKQLEIPKLHKQLEQAKLDPGMLTFAYQQELQTSNNNEEQSSQQELLQPEHISACILRKLYDTAQDYYSQNHIVADDNNPQKCIVTRAVIGVPAYFTESQRQATIRASELAGVPKVKLLAEPEAAALAYGVGVGSTTNSNTIESDADDSELILVFDLGGGTFDVSILEVGGGLTEVLATVGNNRLGGTDFDKRVAEYLCGSAVEYGKKRGVEDKKSSGGSSLDMNEMNGKQTKTKKLLPIKDLFRQGTGEVPDIILRVAEMARKSLSNQKKVEVLVPFTEDGWKKIGGGANGDGDLKNVIGPFGGDDHQNETDLGMVEGDDYMVVSLDRKTFEDICGNELQLLLQPMREVAVMAGAMLPGEARPSYVQNALGLARSMKEADGQDFWEIDDEDDDEDDEVDINPVLIKRGKNGEILTNDEPSVEDEKEDEEEAINEQALQQIYAMDVKAKKKEQQRGRKKARDTAKSERAFRQQRQKANEEATTSALLGKKSGENRRGGNNAMASSTAASGNTRVEDGIHGRLLSRIVLVGGATRMPVIGKLLEVMVGMVPQKTVNPDEAVALGCAVQVGILDGDNEGLLGGMQAVLSPMQAAVMRALAKQRGMDEMMEDEDDDDFDDDFDFDDGGVDFEAFMMGGGGLGGMYASLGEAEMDE